jgi:hypothetical protein
MSEYDGSIIFKEWLPDQPALGNPGLTDAHNTLPIDDTYKSFAPLVASGNTLNARPLGAIEIYQPASNLRYLYAGQTQSIQRQLIGLGSWTNVSGSTTYNAATSTWEFAVYDDQILAANFEDTIQAQTIGAASFTVASASAPRARRLGKVGQFIVAGDTGEATNGDVPYRVQWPAIDDPRNWPLPGSATATAAQAGEQFLDSTWGRVNAIVGGDQFGIVMQRGGLNRMTYVGGNTVFQFDKIAGALGLFLPHSVVEVNGLWYYISEAGIYVTDGVSAQPVGLGKVDRYFAENAILGSFEERVYGAVDPRNKLIKWCYPSGGLGNVDRLLVLNYERKKFSYCTQTCNALVSAPGDSSQPRYIRAFNETHRAARFTGTPGTATLTTGEMEPNPGGYAEEFGIKPLLDVTLNAVTVSMGTRNDQQAAVSYATDQTANSRSGFANFRTAARYHRARLTIAGTFNAAQGLEYQANPAGYT